MTSINNCTRPDKFLVVNHVYVYFSFFLSLKGTVHVGEHVHVNMAELVRGYFPHAVPGSSEEKTQYNDKYKQNWTTGSNKEH